MSQLQRRQSNQSVWDFMSEIERMFETSGSTQISEFQPRMDVKETSDHYLIAADVPGISRDQIKVEFHEGRLTISGERSKETVREESRMHRVERSFGRFERSFQLPNDANGEKIQARFEDGVLEVLIPKSEASRAKTIPVETEKKGLFSKLLKHGETTRTEKEDRADH